MSVQQLSFFEGSSSLVGRIPHSGVGQQQPLGSPVLGGTTHAARVPSQGSIIPEEELELLKPLEDELLDEELLDDELLEEELLEDELLTDDLLEEDLLDEEIEELELFKEDDITPPRSTPDHCHAHRGSRRTEKHPGSYRAVMQWQHKSCAFVRF